MNDTQWPWLLVLIVIFVVGIAMARARARTSRRTPAERAATDAGTRQLYREEENSKD
jgi:hypothetical protein